ncbi:MAG: alanine racemase [Pseudoflavonifractor sp.]|nr:alanine racemase [Alloprevotella sp.]MCM1117149.1 alanine racemase [Pseudoflavonifractor sp.]
MTRYSLGEIAQMLKPHAVDTRLAYPERPIEQLLTDSRSLLRPENTLFFALTTPSGDGHRYIHALYDMGVRAFVVTHIPDEPMPEASFIVVDDTLSALQALGKANRQRRDIPVIAITGSRGKTTVKEMLYRLLSPDHKIARSPRSYNSRIGVPLSLWQIGPEADMAIIEAGISRQGEMALLEDMIAPTAGIFTGIGSDHDSGFPSPEAKLAEKMALFAHCGEPVSSRSVEVTDRVVNPVLKSTTLTYTLPDGSCEAVTIPFTEPALVDDALCCLAMLKHMGYPHSAIAARMASLDPVDTRLNVMEGVGDSLLILDTFTPDISSLPSALDFMARRQTPGHTLTVILSDLIDGDYQEASSILWSRGIDRVIGIGPAISAAADAFAPWGANALFFPSTDIFISSARPADFAHSVVLVKGHASFDFDQIADLLEARRHETVLEVNLDAVADNYNWFRSRLRPSTGLICMIKASGYGAGDIEIAKTLQSHGAAYVAVAVVDEGVALRDAGITMPIMVMNPRVANFRSMFANRLEPEVYSFGLLEDILKAARRCGMADFPIHIKIDTGMHRLGFRLEDIDRIAALLHQPDDEGLLRVASVFSHLAVADMPSEDAYTEEQLAYFAQASQALAALLPEWDIKRHILNSTGIVRFPEHQYDYCRLGIGLYGIPTVDDGSQQGLRPVSALLTSVIAVHDWPAGTTVGYGRYGRLDRPSRIATIPVGYADGIDRHLGRGAMRVWIRGHRCPTVGNICMDACMIDVTELPDCRPGDRVEIFGPHVPAAELADTLSTIPYEILTSVSERVKRIYYRE